MASMASGIGLPPRINTPSISKAKANESAVGRSAGVKGEPGVSGVLAVGDARASSSRFISASSFLAVCKEAAKPPWCDWDLCAIILSGTTTTGPLLSLISLSVAVRLERRRTPGLTFGGAKELAGAILYVGEDQYTPALSSKSEVRSIWRLWIVVGSGGARVKFL